ncbi:Alpha galactosidase, C-terminal beta sandwich domain [Dillenia turbinata]|uniref:alpha-galactosidase n=1 Tax=Dillenia turbinata TaxID=194707 RepID=A0AAN8VA11_9MAGN
MGVFRAQLRLLIVCLSLVSLAIAARIVPHIEINENPIEESSSSATPSRNIFDTSKYGILQLNNGLAQTPQMGLCISFLKVADALISTGLADLGYIYVNIDDCWSAVTRDLKLTLIEQVFTCQVHPGSIYLENDDAELFASWGVDYLKYDNCYNLGIPPEERYPPMRDALNATGHKIFYSLCEWTHMTLDLDPDMLEVGNGGMTFKEYRAHFSIWALMKHNRIVPGFSGFGADPLGIQGRKISVEGSNNCQQVWAGPLSGNRLVVALWNRCSEAANITAKWESLGLESTSTVSVRDLWKHEVVSEDAVTSFSAEVASHDCAMYIFTPQTVSHTDI